MIHGSGAAAAANARGEILMKKDELRKTVERGIGGVPEIKASEKKKWLGEFRERVILGLTVKQCSSECSLHYVREALKDAMAEKLIVNNGMSINTISKFMKLADEMEKNFISRPAQCDNAMGVVISSSVAVDRGNVDLEFGELPIKFIKLEKGKLCNDCFLELEKIKVKHARNFGRITLLDKILGTKCVACAKENSYKFE
ncbi:DUF1694 domain-containing protein [Alkaliphilus sp. AH-315-G20]|nr:DUF1694 domain-containing protein [bacterium AH-315-L21]MBN4062575.1 DUF1694 domain-containing protein [Alkaliphilus sp. AH-315-G20]